jgi:hypothetical protein
LAIATIAELVESERSAGSTDAQVVRLLNASRIKPMVGRKWTVERLVAAFGPRLEGMTRRDGVG